LHVVKLSFKRNFAKTSWGGRARWSNDGVTEGKKSKVQEKSFRRLLIPRDTERGARLNLTT